MFPYYFRNVVELHAPVGGGKKCRFEEQHGKHQHQLNAIGGK
jgi:hypothetical protein